MKKPVLYLMIGFPASGKSTFLEKQKELAVNGVNPEMKDLRLFLWLIRIKVV